MSKFLFVLNINTSKVDMPNSITDLNLAPVFMWLSMAPSSMNGYQKRYMFERYRTTCSKYDTRPRFNSGHNCGGGGMVDLYDHFTSTRIFTLETNKLFA